jgi:hypothetical protein
MLWGLSIPSAQCQVVFVLEHLSSRSPSWADLEGISRRVHGRYLEDQSNFRTCLASAQGRIMPVVRPCLGAWCGLPTFCPLFQWRSQTNSITLVIVAQLATDERGKPLGLNAWQLQRKAGAAALQASLLCLEASQVLLGQLNVYVRVGHVYAIDLGSLLCHWHVQGANRPYLALVCFNLPSMQHQRLPPTARLANTYHYDYHQTSCINATPKLEFKSIILE